MSAPDVPPLAPARTAESSNVLGVAGFVVSLVGLVLTCGVLCPVGVVLSVLGLRKEPRGFAIAGAAIGGVGTMLAIVVAVFVLKAAHLVGRTLREGGLEFEGPRVSTEISLSMAEELIDLDSAEKGRLPTDEDGTALLVSLTDGWGHALRYERGTEDGYTIRSAGPDAAFGTADDVATSR